MESSLPFLKKQILVKSFLVFMLVTGLAVLPSCASKKTGATGKTKAQCKADLTKCKGDCDKTMIDVGDQIKNCKDQCLVDYNFCLPARTIGPLDDKPTTVPSTSGPSAAPSETK